MGHRAPMPRLQDDTPMLRVLPMPEAHRAEAPDRRLRHDPLRRSPGANLASPGRATPGRVSSKTARLDLDSSRVDYGNGPAARGLLDVHEGDTQASYQVTTMRSCRTSASSRALPERKSVTTFSIRRRSNGPPSIGARPGKAMSASRHSGISRKYRLQGTPNPHFRWRRMTDGSRFTTDRLRRYLPRHPFSRICDGKAARPSTSR